MLISDNHLFTGDYPIKQKFNEKISTIFTL